MTSTNLYGIIRRRAEDFPSVVALGGSQGIGWHTLASTQLLDRTDQLAEELAERLGIGTGDRVILWVPNGWRTPVYLFALWKLGAIIVPFDRDMNADAARSIIHSVAPRCILVGYDDRPTWLEGSANAAAWWEPGERSTALSSCEAADAEIALIVFTSGTTGNPKGCVITHANLRHQVNALGENVPIGPGCRLASVLPLSHLFELTCGLLYPLAAGATIHYAPSRRGPDVLAVLQQQRITHLIAVPQLLTLMGQAIEEQLRKSLPNSVYRGLIGLADRAPFALRRRLFGMVHRKLGGALVMIASGGAALPAETQRRWERLGIRIVPGYGTSECAPVVAAGAPDGSTPLGSVGKPLRAVAVRLSPEGELEVRGPNVMRGYWRDPARTAEVLRDGWYATGDQARIDDHGNLWILGRVRDLIVLPSGLNVWPEDLETALRAHPSVKDAAVIAVPSASGGATLHAYLIPRTADAAIDPRAVLGWANARLAVHQRVATASWWSGNDGDFPRTNTLKVRRHLLPIPADAAKPIRPPVAGDPIGQAIAAATRIPDARGDQTLAELGVDSLGLSELQVQLEERLGITIPEGTLRADQTIDILRAAIEELTDVGAVSALADEVGAGPGSTPRWPYTWGRVFRPLAAPLDFGFRRAATRIEIEGSEHLRALPHAVIFAGTHRSFPDLPLLRYALRRSGRADWPNRLIIAATSTHYASAGVLGTLGTLLFGLYPIQQHRNQRASLNELAQLARGGGAVLIFPQGKHTDPALERAAAPIARFRPGVSHLARALNTAVIPFGIAGTEALVPPAPPSGFRGLVVPGNIPLSVRRGPVAIVFGAPVTPEPGESPPAFAERLQGICFALARRAEELIDALP